MIPDYQSLMLPLLRLVADKQEHKYRDLIEKLAIEFHVTDEERKELLASGNQAIFDNRVGWAKTYLKKAGAIDQPKRGVIKITECGHQILSSNPISIDLKGKQQPSQEEMKKISHCLFSLTILLNRFNLHSHF